MSVRARSFAPALIETIAARAGIRPSEAKKALLSTLATLGERLVKVDAQALADALPLSLRRAVLLRAAPGEFDVEKFFARIAVREKVRGGFAREHAQVVCAVLAATIPPDVRERLCTRLPPDLAELFVPASVEPAPPHVREARAVAPGTGRTLANGKRGSRHPLADARPPGAMRESLGRSNPHGLTKLSSAEGERRGTTLASGRPGSTRPLSEGEG